MPHFNPPRSPYRFSWIIYLCLVSLALLVNYPGRLNDDSIDMVNQGVNLDILTDWHAPILTFLYTLFGPVLMQPAGSLLLQSLLLFPFLALVPAAKSDRAITFADVLLFAIWLGLTAALIAIAGQIVKDVILIGAVLSLCCVVDQHPDYLKSGSWILVKLALLVIIFAVRPTNFLMIAVAGTIISLVHSGMTRKSFKIVLVLFVFCASSIPVLNFIDYRVLGAKNSAEESSLIIFDAAGISSQLHQDLFSTLPDWPKGVLPKPWDCYTPHYWDVFKWGKCKKYAEIFDEVMHQSKDNSMVEWWWVSLVIRHPLAYLMHRSLFAEDILSNSYPLIGWGPPYAINSTKFLDRMNGHITHNIDMTSKVQLWTPNILFNPFNWAAARIFARHYSIVCGFLLCTFLVGWCFWCRLTGRKYDLVALALAATGIGNVIMMAFLGVAAESRYLAPTIIFGIAALLRAVRIEFETRQTRKHV